MKTSTLVLIGVGVVAGAAAVYAWKHRAQPSTKAAGGETLPEGGSNVPWLAKSVPFKDGDGVRLRG